MDDKIHSLRDALEWLDRNIEDEAAVDGEMSNANAIRLGFIRAMLAKFPLRNCDVGTAKQQQKRYMEECLRSLDCYKCKLDQGGCDCRFHWGQMPYEKNESESK